MAERRRIEVADGPLVRYREAILRGALQPDVEQAAIVARLDAISADLLRRKRWAPPSRSLFSRWRSPSESAVRGVTGLYLWGGVGRGKTCLCDMFFESLAFEDKTRLHFHRFMQRIHADLRALGNVDDPLPRIADDWASRARLLLLDEIHVHDITDAMLLGGLLTALFARGVTLVTTSNVPPDGLYREGLQRARFLPAIAQIVKHTDVVEMLGESDYRLRLMQSEPIYIVGKRGEDGLMDAATQASMKAHFVRLASRVEPEAGSISINDRTLPVRGVTGDLVWFDYATLCDSPRSTADFAEIANEFHTVLLSGVPVLGKDQDDQARRLVNLVDEFYDRRVKLIVSAAAPAGQIYVGQRLAFEFTRAVSRLTEMRSREYLASRRLTRDDS